MMYYQMAIIAAKEKKWFSALEKMGFVVYYLKGLGGINHKNFIIRLLKKYKKDFLLDKYLELAENTHPSDFASRLSIILNT